MMNPGKNPNRNAAPQRRNRPLAEIEAEQQQKQQTAQHRVRVGKIRLPKRSARYAIYAGAILLVLLVANLGTRMMPCRGIEVTIHRQADNDILPVDTVITRLQKANGVEIVGLSMNHINLKQLEDSLYKLRTFQKVELYKSFMGKLVAEVTLRQPIARVMDVNSTSCYIDSLGVKFPTSTYRAAHVPLVRGNFIEELKDTTYLNKALKYPANSYSCISIYETLPVLKYIYKHPFWKAQIAEIYIEQDGQLMLYPAVSDAKIEFGFPTEIHEKFEDLLLFYREVPKQMGWNRYKMLSVKYRGQVVGRK